MQRPGACNLPSRRSALIILSAPLAFTIKPGFGTASSIKGVIKTTVAVKGDPDSQQLGDCPFSQRVLLTLEAKRAPYERLLYDVEKRRPEWLNEKIDKAGGHVPVLIEEGGWCIADSNEIVQLLEERYPEPALKSDVPPDVGAQLFPALKDLLLCQGPQQEVAACHGLLHDQLRTMHDHLVLAGKGPLFGGEQLNATDASLAPKLHHAIVALGYYRGWHLPKDLFRVQEYYDAVRATPAWQNTAYSDRTVIAGWARHGAKKVDERSGVWERNAVEPVSGPMEA